MADKNEDQLLLNKDINLVKEHRVLSESEINVLIRQLLWLV